MEDVIIEDALDDIAKQAAELMAERQVSNIHTTALTGRPSASLGAIRTASGHSRRC